MVSVVVPCKNDARYLPHAIESILSQNYKRLECLVVDGGSTDGTLDLLKQYGDRIRWVSEPDRGAFDAINRGWKLSQGEILTWLNADDLWVPGTVRSVVEAFASNPEADVVYGNSGFVDEAGRVRGDLIPRTWDLEYALRNCDHVIFQPAAFMRRRVLEQVGWLYPAWCHDHDLWLRIARAGGIFQRLPVHLSLERMRPQNLGHVAELVIPAKIELVNRFFAAPGLPGNIQNLRRRALSGTYMRGLDYLRSDRLGHCLWAARLVMRAVAVDPGSIRFIGGRAILFSRAVVGGLVMKIPGLGRFKRWAGRFITRVFEIGNMDLGLQIDGLRQGVDSVGRTLASIEAAADRIRGSLSLREIYGAPLTLRRIPGWTISWDVDRPSDPLRCFRGHLWDSLESPVLMRWLADLLIMIWPRNELSRVLFLTGNFEPNELTWVSETLSKGMTMIDVGAHMGMYSMIGAKLVGESGTVIAVEPSTREFQRLAFHIELNHLSNVRCLQVAASASAGEATLKVAWEWNSGHNTFGEFFSPSVEITREERVAMQTVDAIVIGQALQRVDLIKIDVEGHEVQVLAGAVETLARFRPRVLIEVFGETLRRQGSSAEAVLTFLEEKGYNLHEFSEASGEAVPLSRRDFDSSRNLIALPN